MEASPISSLDSELLYLIAQYLSSGPCQRAAEALKSDLEEKGLLARRYDWTGQSHQQQLSALQHRLPHIGPGHLPQLLQALVQLWNTACQPAVPGLSSLCNVGALSLLDVTQDERPIERPADALVAVHYSRPAPSIHRHRAPTMSLLRAREVSGVISRKHVIVPSRFYSKFRKYRRFMGHLCASYCVLYDKTGTRVITGADDCLLKIWSAHDGRLVSTLRGHQSEVADIAIDLENRLIASGGCDKVIRVWNLQSRAPVAVLLRHTGVITSLQFCPYPGRNVRYLVSTGADGNVFFWEYNPNTFVFCPTPTMFMERGKPGDQILCSSFSAGGCLLVCGGTDHVVRLYQSHPGPPERLAELDGHTDRVQTVQFAHRGNRFVSGGRDGSARIWSHTGTVWKCVVLSMHTKLPNSTALKVNKLNVTMVAWDLHDKHVITASNDTLLKVWNPDTGTLVHEMKGHDDVVFVLEAHPTDGRILMSAGHDGVIALWDLTDGTLLKRFENKYHGNGVASVFDCKFSPDGMSMVCCDSQGQLSFFGVTETTVYDKVPDQQFFHTDYHSVVRDVNNHVLDEQTELPPHGMPPPLLVNMDCNPYPPFVQRLVTGYTVPQVKAVKKECKEDTTYRGIDETWPAIEARRRRLNTMKEAQVVRWRREHEELLAAMRANPRGEFKAAESDSDDGDDSYFNFAGELAEDVVKRRRHRSQSLSVVSSGDLDAVLSPPPAPSTPVTGGASTPFHASAAREAFSLPTASPHSSGGGGNQAAVAGLARASTPMRALKSPPPLTSPTGFFHPVTGLATVSEDDGAASGGPQSSASVTVSLFSSSTVSSALAIAGPVTENSPVRDFPASTASGGSVATCAGAATGATTASSSSSSSTTTSSSTSSSSQLPDHRVDYSATGGEGLQSNNPGEQPMEVTASDTATTTTAATAAFQRHVVAPASNLAAAAVAREDAPRGLGAVPVIAALGTAGENVNGGVGVNGGLRDINEEDEEEETDAQRAQSMAERYVRQQHAANTAVQLHQAATSCPSVDILLEHWRKRPSAPTISKPRLREEEQQRMALGDEEVLELVSVKQSLYIPFTNGPSALPATNRTIRAVARGRPQNGSVPNAGSLIPPQIDVVQASPPANGSARPRRPVPGNRLSRRSDSNRSLQARNEEEAPVPMVVSDNDNDDEDFTIANALDSEMSSSSSSSSEDSDCSDWSEDAGIARARRAAARRREAEAERQAQAASSQSGSAAAATSRPATAKKKKKKKPAPPKREPVKQVMDPAELERFWPSPWLTNTQPLPQPYFPQQGDKVVYSRQGHEAYVESIKTNNVYRINYKMLPWTKKKLPIQAHEVCHVINVHFVVGPPTLCSLKLRLISSCPNRRERATFSVQYHDYDSVPDFIVLYSRVKESLECQWKPGDQFRCMIDHQYWMGNILERKPYQSEYPDSLWQCYDVRWDGGETELLSPWDMERVVGQPEGGQNAVQSNNRLIIRTRRQSAAVANDVALGTAQAQIDAERWLLPTDEELENNSWGSEDVDTACMRIADGLTKVQEELEIAEPFSYSVDYREAYPQYCVCIAVPTCLDTILEKVKNKFYRRVAALLWEVRLLQKNAYAFNEEDSDIVRISSALYSLLRKFIKTPSCHDPVALYHSGANLSGDDDDDVEADEFAVAAVGITAAPAAASSTASSPRVPPASLSGLSAGAAAAALGQSTGDSDDEDEDEDRPATAVNGTRPRRRGVNGVSNGALPPSDSSSEDDADEDDDGRGTMRVTRGKRQQLHDEGQSVEAQDPAPTKLPPHLYHLAISFIDLVKAEDDSGVFLEPVDTETYHDYCDYVDQPMDFKTLHDNLLNREYGTVGQFCNAFELIFSNSRAYNSQKTSLIYRLTTRVWRKFTDLRDGFIQDCTSGACTLSALVATRVSSQQRLCRQSARHANSAMKRRHPADSSSAGSSSSSDGENGNGCEESDGESSSGSGSGSGSGSAEGNAGESSGSNEESAEDGDDSDDEVTRRRPLPRRKPGRPPRAKPAPKPSRVKKSAQPPAKRRRKAARSSDSDMSDADRNAHSMSTPSSVEAAADTVAGVSRSGRPIRKSSRYN